MSGQFERAVLAAGDFAIVEGTVFVSCRKGSLADLMIAKRIIEKLIEEEDDGTADNTAAQTDHRVP